ncbi:MAG: thioredoxin, partial [Chloroflexi bacterium]|nr:thioredoxin [Chloroflexota bacterium]
MSEPLVDARPLRERIADLDLDRLADLDAAQERLHAAGLTDGLPAIPPTAARVAAMLQGCDPSGHPALGPLPPGFMTPTPWDLAACAVLAGCRPGVLPLMVAALSAVVDPAFNLLGIQTTTGAAAPLFVVNGPVVGALGINAGHSALGPGARANAAIGRALRLVLQNVGLAVPGAGDMATHGHPGKYTWLVAEHEAESPWPPLHATRGLPANASAVTAVGGVGNVEVVLPLSSAPALVRTMGRSMLVGGNLGHGHFGSGQPLVLLPPECARFLAKHGYDRARFQAEL